MANAGASGPAYPPPRINPTAIAWRAHGLGMRVIFYDHVDKLALGNAQPVKSLKELFKQVHQSYDFQSGQAERLIDARTKKTEKLTVFRSKHLVD